MHVYLREEPVHLRMLAAEAEGLVPEDAQLVPMAFYVQGNDHPSFRALLPPETVEVLTDALVEPVTLGVLAEEPRGEETEIHAMIGLAVPVDGEIPEEVEGELTADAGDTGEPWRASAGNPEAWRGADADDADGMDGEEVPRTALLAFAPLIRLERKFPLDFGEELADLLETALSGATRPALEARVDRMLGEL